MDAKTARNIAIGCFGLAAILGVMSATGAFESKPKPPQPPPQCQYGGLPALDQYIPSGDWCFRLSAGQTLHIKVGYPFEIGIKDILEVRLDVFDPSGNKYPHETQTLRPNACVRLPARWSRAEITAINGSGVVRLRPVGNYPDRINDC